VAKETNYTQTEKKYEAAETVENNMNQMDA
jgi:hypothetical protein